MKNFKFNKYFIIISILILIIIGEVIFLGLNFNKNLSLDNENVNPPINESNINSEENSATTNENTEYDKEEIFNEEDKNNDDFEEEIPNMENEMNHINKEDDLDIVEENDEDKIDSNLKDGVILQNTQIKDNTIIQEYLVTLNGKRNILKVEYDYNYSYEYYLIGYIHIEKVIGQFQDHEFYFYETFSDEGESTVKSKIFNVDTISSKFNEKNFQIIKGEDGKNYLLVITYQHYSLTPSNSDAASLYIFNDNLEIVTSDLYNHSGCKSETMTINSGITTLILKDNIYPWYEDSFGVCVDNEKYCRINVKIEDNQIYYLMPVFNESLGYLEERRYKINNSKLVYEIVNVYELETAVGEVCIN